MSSRSYFFPLLCRLCVFSFVVRHFFLLRRFLMLAQWMRNTHLCSQSQQDVLFSCHSSTAVNPGWHFFFLHAITHLHRPALTVLYPTYTTHIPHPVYPYWLIVQVVLKENVNISIGLGGLGDWFISTPPSCFLIQTNQERERIVVHPEPERLFECHWACGLEWMAKERNDWSTTLPLIFWVVQTAKRKK